MQYFDSIQEISISLGFSSSVILCISNINSIRKISDLSLQPCDVHDERLKELSSQNIANIIGFIYLALSFILQIFQPLIVKNTNLSSYNLLIIFVVILLSLFFAFLAHVVFTKIFIRNVEKEQKQPIK